MISNINVKNQQASSKIIQVLICYTLCQNQKCGVEGKMMAEHSVTFKSISDNYDLNNGDSCSKLMLK